MAKDRQSSWASGELTPDLHGQAGSPVYQRGAALLRNFMVTPQGPVINRSGSVHVKELPNKTTARLVPFLFGEDPPRIAAIQGLNAGVVMLDKDGELADPVNGDWTAGSVSAKTPATTTVRPSKTFANVCARHARRNVREP